MFSDLWFVSVSHTFHKMSSFVERREINVLFIFLLIRGNSFVCVLGQRDSLGHEVTRMISGVYIFFLGKSNEHQRQETLTA